MEIGERKAAGIGEWGAGRGRLSPLLRKKRKKKTEEQNEQLRLRSHGRKPPRFTLGF